MADQDLYAYVRGVTLSGMTREDAKKSKDNVGPTQGRRDAKAKYNRLAQEAKTASEDANALGEHQPENLNLRDSHQYAADAHKRAFRQANKLPGHEAEIAKHREAADFHSKEAKALGEHADAQKKADELKSKLSPSTRKNALGGELTPDKPGSATRGMNRAMQATDPKDQAPTNKEASDRRAARFAMQTQEAHEAYNKAAKEASDATDAAVNHDKINVEHSTPGYAAQRHAEEGQSKHWYAHDAHAAAAVKAKSAGMHEAAKAHEHQAAKHEEGANGWADWDAEHGGGGTTE